MNKSGSEVFREIMIAEMFIIIATMGASFFFREFALPRSIILMAFGFRVLMLNGWKLVYLRWFQSHKDQKVLLIGEGKESSKLVSMLKKQRKQTNKITHLHSTTSLDVIPQSIAKHDLVVIGTNLEDENKSFIMYEAMKQNKNIFIVPALYELLLSKSDITNMNDTMVIGVQPFGIPTDQLFIKRTVDIVVSSIGLILSSPIMLIVAILNKLEEKNASVFYKQKRLGKNNKTFEIYKFRSMVNNAESKTGPTLATADDDRITRVGHFIRKTRIDELPQLWNVLIGQMSIVGPRPEREVFMQKFQKDNKSYNYRSSVKPGITGYAQVMGKYTSDVEDKLRFDLYYIRSYSFWLDISIMFKTVGVILDKTKSEGKKEKRSKTSPTHSSKKVTIHS